MIAIRTVVCPVDFSPATARQVDLASDVCRAFGARLVLHHNVSDLSVGAAVGWMWYADREPLEPSSVDERMRNLISSVPAGINVEGCITRGAVTEGVLAVAKAAGPGCLIVLSEHAGKAEDHKSVIEYLLERANTPVLALHDPGTDIGMPDFSLDDGKTSGMREILVPLTLSTELQVNVEFACDLARVFPLHLHFLHVVETGDARAETSANQDGVRSKLEALVPEDLAGRATVHIASGEPIVMITRMAAELAATCIVMGEHARTPLKRWFTEDIARAVLHDAPCPVWFVPSVPPDQREWLSRFALSKDKSILWGNV
jgi:nucleotide-binding universal stress UspA family protein